MNNHYYKINGQIRRQAEGGAIGSELTGEVARNFMVNWDKRYLKVLKTLGITKELYARYVDDILVSLNVINKGWRFDGDAGKLVFSEDKAKVDTRTGMERTAQILVDIANSLDKNIQFTWDIPEKNKNGRGAILSWA